MWTKGATLRHCVPFRSEIRLTTSQGRTAKRLECWTQLSVLQHMTEGLSELLQILGFRYKEIHPTPFGLLAKFSL